MGIPTTRGASTAKTAPGKKTGAGVKKTTPAQQRKVTTKKKNPDIVDIFAYKKIAVYRPGEEAYQRSIATANRLFRFSQPACVVQPESSAHVQYIVKQAKLQNIPITIKNGGHSFAGSSTANKGILLDLKNMSKVHLDMDSMTITLQGGAKWGHAYKELAKGHHDGYIVNGGRCPTVGVSGYVLGGGLGPFTRSFGMGCDTLKQATIVTADGCVVTVKDTDDPESPKGKLFWALCGAGGGNFGVVVELKQVVQKLQSKDGIVVAGRFVWRSLPEDILTTMNRFYVTNWPDQMTIDSTWLCDLRDSPDLGVRFIVYYDGNKHHFNNQINKSIVHKELGNLLKCRTKAEKSSQWLYESLPAQWREDTEETLPESKSWSVYSSFAFGNDQARIESIISIVKEELEAFRDKFKGEQVLAQVTFIHSGGQAAKRQRSDTAFRWRDAVYHAYIMVQWDDPWMGDDMRDFCRKFKARLRPFSTTGQAAFINFPDASLGPDAAQIAYYGSNSKKLQLVKQIWDKDNYFDWAQGVRLPHSNQSTIPLTPPISPKFGSSKVQGKKNDIAEMASKRADEKAADEELFGDESEVDEAGMTDTIAAQQWENYNLPPTNDFVGMEGIPYWRWV